MRLFVRLFVMYGLILSQSNVMAESDTSQAKILQLEALLQQQQARLEQLTEQVRQLTMAKSVPATAETTPASARSGSATSQAETTQLRDQQWQLQAMSDELAALHAARGKAEGRPVFASFKDGVKLQDGSGNWQLAINGRVQADYRSFSPDADAADTFSLRRARLGATMTFYKDYAARLEGEYAGGANTLTYGYFDINKWSAARLRVGQFKPFYGMERAMNTNFTDFLERSMADALLGSTFDRGVMLFGEPMKGLGYSLAYINGTGTSDENNAKVDGKDVTARVTANLADFMGWNNSVVHIGSWFAHGDEGSRRQAGFIPTLQTEGRGLAFFSTTCGATACGAATANAFKENVTRTRSGAELAYAYQNFKLQSEYIRTRFEGEGFDRDLNAWYASVLWNVTGEVFAPMYKEGVFGRLKPINDLGQGGWGAVQLGVRYSRFDGSDFSKLDNTANSNGALLNNPTGTADGLLVATNQADAWTLGANWILNPNARILMNWIHTQYDTPVLVRVNGKNHSLDKEDALTMRAQFDF